MKLHVAAAVLQLTSSLWAQTAFDVVSVKPNVSGDPGSPPTPSPGRFSWTNASLRQLIQVAYDRRPFQLIGMPDWADTTHVDVVATTRPDASPQEMNVMLQSLLAERFELAVHRDTRVLPVYALVQARGDGKLGPSIHPAAVDCESVNAKALNDGTTQAYYSKCTPQMGLTRLKATGFRMTTLGSALMRLFDRSVIDKTGISGAFDIELTWVPDPTMLPNGVPPPPAGGPSIFTALEEQLGLKLVSDRGPVDVLVIDHLSRPKPD